MNPASICAGVERTLAIRTRPMRSSRQAFRAAMLGTRRRSVDPSIDGSTLRRRVPSMAARKACREERMGRVRIAKVRSTPAQIEAGFIDGLRALLERAAAAPSSVDYLAHGSTVATNAIV